MMNKVKNHDISAIVFELTILVLQIVYVESYSIRCPSQANWKLRAHVKCNSILKYFCLYNNVDEKYVEGCEGPDWDRKGNKRIFSVSFTRGQCIQMRYQPFQFQTNESMTNCIYAKSLCSEEGQIVYTEDSSKNDKTCRCDYRRNYSFTKTPKHVCYCIPTEEDCSCYIKACQLNFTLSTDYNCTRNGYKENPKCRDTIRDSTTIEEQIEVDTEKNNIYTEHRWTLAYVMLVLVCFIFLGAIGAFFVATENLHQIPITVLNIAPKWFRKKLQSSERCIGGGQTDTDETDIRRTGSVKTLETEASYKSTTYDQTHDTDETGISRTESVKTYETDASYKSTTYDQTHDADGTNVVRTELLATVDGNDHGYCKDHVENGSFKASTEEIKVEMHNTLRLAELTQDEVNYLRMIHLLFRVACPAVRKIFNHEIQPHQLRKTLDKKKAVMKKKYRKKARIINNCQWNLLYGPVTGNTVTSDDLDITIMIHLLVTLTHIEVGDLYPVQSDERLSAMLSRINYIRNELAQSYKGTLSGDQFNKYWDDIAQAVFKLVHLYGTANDKDVNYQQISRLHMLNLIDLDNDKLCLYIDSVLQGALKELLNVIDDETFRNNMLQQISSRNPHKLEDTKKRSIASGWISKQLQNQKSTPETSFGIYVFNQDDLTFKRIHIPKDVSLPNRTRHFKDLTDEEINFLLVVYGLTKIVYPAIKDEFDTKCPDHELEKIRMEIYEQQRTVGMKNSHSDKKKNIYLTQKQREQLLSPKMGESRKLDLKLMIYILRRKAEENSEKDYVDHLDVIDNVRREIFQSSSGVLNKWKFQEMLKLVSKAIVHIGGEQYDAKIANLHDIRNSLVVDLL